MGNGIEKRMNFAIEIQRVINTLEDTKVSGAENMRKMIGCIEHLETVKKELMKHENADPSVQQRNSEDAAAAV